MAGKNDTDGIGSIISTSSNNPTVTANTLELNAIGDISKISTSINKVAAKSINGAIDLTNNKSSLITKVGSTKGLVAANNINYKTKGTLTQTVGSDIISQNDNINLTSDGNFKFDYIQAPKRVTLSSLNGAITQDGDSAVDIQSNELLLKAKNGIGDDGVNEKGIDTKIDILDAYNQSANNLVISNEGDLLARDLDFDGYVLYNGGGDIKITTAGGFTQQTNTLILSNRDISVNSVGDIFAVNMKASRDLSLESQSGDIISTSRISPNLSIGRRTSLIAKNGFVGTPKNTIDIKEGSQGVFVKAKKAKNLLSVYIRGIVAPINNYSNQKLALFNNRPISGTKIENYLKTIFSNSIRKQNSVQQFFFKPIKQKKKILKLVELF